MLPCFTASIGPRAFCSSGPTSWKTLPARLRHSSLTLEQFKCLIARGVIVCVTVTARALVTVLCYLCVLKCLFIIIIIIFIIITEWTTHASWHQTRFVRFKNIVFTCLVTDGRTDGRTGRQHNASASQCGRAYA